MDKFEDAFKKISKVNLATHSELWGEPKTEKLYFEAGQQSRQSEFDAMTEALLNQTQLLAKKQAEINQLQSQINEMAEVGLSQESVIREKDKQIEAVNLILTELKNSKYMHSANKSYNSILIEKLDKALRGEHEA